MGENIEIKINYTADDFARGLKYIQQRNVLVKYIYLSPVLAIFFMFLIFFIKDPQKIYNVFSRPQGFLPFIIAFAAVIPIFYLLKKRKSSFLVRKQFERQIRSSPVLQETKTLVFDEKGLRVYQSLADAEINWSAFIEATETEDDFYLFTAKRVAQIIPKRVFENEVQQNQLKELTKKMLGEKAKF